METMIDVMTEGWSEVISGYFDHLFCGPGELCSWLCGDTVLL